MKKAFTMIELIFVIVILGILASVAIPRLAATREDAEISATVANLRTLISDASSYYVAKGFFSDGKTTANWRDITNVPLRLKAGTAVEGSTDTGTETYLSASGKNCIKIEVKDRKDNTPAHIVVSKVDDKEYICGEIYKAEPVKAYLDSKLPNSTTDGIALGASTRIYNSK